MKRGVIVKVVIVVLILIVLIILFYPNPNPTNSDYYINCEENSEKSPYHPFNYEPHEPIVSVYKLKNSSYNDKVRVTLSKDLKKIGAYPDGSIKPPTFLDNGYILDIGWGSGCYEAVINFTYEEYSKNFDHLFAPEMFASILDTKPHQEYYACGPISNFEDPEENMNEIISNNRLDWLCYKII